MGIAYRVLAPRPDDPDFDRAMAPIVACDRAVYGTDPTWREGKTCPACARTAGGPGKWTFDEAPERCPACGAELADFWPAEALLADYRADAGRANYAFVVAYDGERVVGAFRGWSMTGRELDRHLNDGLPSRRRATPPLAGALRTRFPGVTRFAYESSVFLLPGYRGRGIGGRATQIGQRLLWDAGLRAFVVRTKTSPPAVTYPWYSDGLDYERIAAYDDADKRVVLARFHAVRP